LAEPYAVPATILVGATESNEVELNGTVPVGIYVPAGAEGVTLTFKASADEGGTKVPVVDIANVAYSVTIGATASYVSIAGAVFKGVHYLTVVAAQQAGSDLNLILSCRPGNEA